jgi:uncharacterized Fe-S cluster-containing radical SAM superfamily protein
MSESIVRISSVSPEYRAQLCKRLETILKAEGLSFLRIAGSQPSSGLHYEEVRYYIDGLSEVTKQKLIKHDIYDFL